MEQHNHSNGNGVLHHQASSKTTNNPSFRVYVDMIQEHYPNNSTVYTSEDKKKKTCISTLIDDSHYKFACRCGCGARMAGYGRDIKAASRMGRDLKPEILFNDVITTTPVSLPKPISFSNAPLNASTLKVNDIKLDDIKLDDIKLDDIKLDETFNLQPFVSDRYLKKALYGLSDDEINSYHEDKPDPLELRGVNLAERQPPAIGELVYSLATREGPYTLIEYKDQEIKPDNGILSRVLCGLCRKNSGKYLSIPLADLVTYEGDNSLLRQQWSKSKTLLVMISISILGSIVGYFVF